MDLLINSDEEWERLRPLLKAKDEATFTLLRDKYREGIKRVKAGKIDTQAAGKLYEILAKVGGEKVVGSNPKFDASLFTSPTQ